MIFTFNDQLVQMHDDELSLPSIEVALEKHLALTGGDAAQERARLAATFRAQRGDTVLGKQVLDLLLNPQPK